MPPQQGHLPPPCPLHQAMQAAAAMPQEPWSALQWWLVRQSRLEACPHPLVVPVGQCLEAQCLEVQGQCQEVPFLVAPCPVVPSQGQVHPAGSPFQEVAMQQRPVQQMQQQGGPEDPAQLAFQVLQVWQRQARRHLLHLVALCLAWLVQGHFLLCLSGASQEQHHRPR